MQKVRINKIAENDNASVRPILNTVRPAASASEVTTVWCYRNLIIITTTIIITYSYMQMQCLVRTTFNAKYDPSQLKFHRLILSFIHKL